MLADIQKKITLAFDIFDLESNKTVDVRFVLIGEHYFYIAYIIIWVILIKCTKMPT